MCQCLITRWLVYAGLCGTHHPHGIATQGLQRKPDSTITTLAVL